MTTTVTRFNAAKTQRTLAGLAKRLAQLELRTSIAAHALEAVATDIRSARRELTASAEELAKLTEDDASPGPTAEVVEHR